MKITLDMLSFLLSENALLSRSPGTLLERTARFGRPDQEILHIKNASVDGSLKPDTLYAADASVWKNYASAAGAGKQVILAFPPGTSDDVFKKFLADFRPSDNVIFYETTASAAVLAERLQDIFQQLLRWETDFIQGILSEENAETLFASGNDIFRRDYAIVDVDMSVAYCTEGYRKSRQIRGGRLSEDIFQSLVARKEFHDVASETKSFYYPNVQTEKMILCHNIFAGGQYIARLVLLLRDDEERLPAGGRKLFEHFAQHIQMLYSRMNLMPLHHSADNMHALVRAVLAGEERDRAAQQMVLGTYNWNTDHRFSAVVLRFFSGAGWDPQLLTMLPFLAVQLERLYRGSCAVPSGKEIVLVIDHDSSDSRPGNSTVGAVSQHAGQKVRGGQAQGFWQPLAYFVRDNMCKAGISPDFQDFLLLPDAVKAARAALETGSIREPDFWYYRFDDFRLPFVMSELRNILSPALLRHPAIGILSDYDREHSTQLCETLEAYLINSGNMTAAAEKLYIHRTSFFRRMNLILSLTDLDLADPDTVFSLLLSFRLM